MTARLPFDTLAGAMPAQTPALDALHLVLADIRREFGDRFGEPVVSAEERDAVARIPDLLDQRVLDARIKVRELSEEQGDDWRTLDDDSDDEVMA